MSRIAQSLQIASNQALDELVRTRSLAGEPVLHLGFGESGLPVFPGLRAAMARPCGNGYGPIAGSAAVRESVAGYFTRRGLRTTPDQVMVAPGSKPLLAALVAALPGDVVLPKPSWVTYVQQARLFGRAAIDIEIPHSAGGIPDPQLMRGSLRKARSSGHDPRTLVLTTPDNPTGTVATDELIRQVCEIAGVEDLVVISDEIYSDVVFDGGDIARPATYLPDRTVIVTGLSKSLSLGGWRIGAVRVPDNDFGEQLLNALIAVASQVWSNLATPMQSVAEYAFAEPPELVEFRKRCTAVHAAVALAVHRLFDQAGLAGRRPTGAFYVYPDFTPLAAELAGIGIAGSAALQEWLLTEHGIAVLGGHAFGDHPNALRFRAATSLLYGSSESERMATLDAADPTAAPSTRAALLQIEAALEKIGRTTRAGKGIDSSASSDGLGGGTGDQPLLEGGRSR